MTFREFLQKWDIDPSVNDQVNPMDMGGWLSAMDYMFCTKTKAQVLEMVGEFYDNADDIYNSLNEEANKTMTRLKDMGLLDEDGAIVEEPKDDSHDA